VRSFARTDGTWRSLTKLQYHIFTRDAYENEVIVEQGYPDADAGDKYRHANACGTDCSKGTPISLCANIDVA